MRQLITSNVVNFVIKKHGKKRRETFVNTVKEKGTVWPVMARQYVNTSDVNARVSNAKALLPRHQNHQINHHWLDSLIMLKTGFVQW